MRKVRIWAEDSKRCEAVWLKYLLDICGCQVWNYRISEIGLFKRIKRRPYVDILVFEQIDRAVCKKFIDMNPNTSLFACGERQVDELGVFYWHEYGQLDMYSPKSIYDLMETMQLIFAPDKSERKAIRILTECYTKDQNILARSMYTILEMFCSRKVDYRKYKSYSSLVNAIKNMETWYENYLKNMQYELSYHEMYAMLYLQNVINEGYIKARKRGGFDTSILLGNVDYLAHIEKNEAETLYLLKLKILHNCNNYDEGLNEILKKAEKSKNKRYQNRIYAELGDIFRDSKVQKLDARALEYYEKVKGNELENYRVFYKSALLYEKQGELELEFYMKALKRYIHIINLIGEIKFQDRTPQEFEYYYKALLGKVKVLIVYNKMGKLSDYGKEQMYKDIRRIEYGCMNFDKLRFLSKFYADTQEYWKMLQFMQEKMEKVQMWLTEWKKDLCEECI